ncbi:MFS transporter [Paracoccus versutus]|uniref:MFS transporter n=1 Tax=Paracoccus versutus TaxID=34007 RepID=UPI0015EFFCDE|nr:MFS transporter [Paracoccus versutus]
MDIREAIRTQPMRPFQVWIVAICVLLAMIDGYEVVVMPFTMPHLAQAWALTPVQIGYLLSAGIFGMALGAALISPLADRIGRRRHILLCLAMITLGMALSAMAQNVGQLVAVRAFAGLFIGAVISSLNIMVAEYSSERRRGTVMGLYGVGLPLGSALAGLAIVELVGAYSWRAPFAFGALLTAVMFVVVLVSLPESIEYLVEKRPAGALESYNRIGRRLGFAPAKALPERQSHIAGEKPWRETFRGITGLRTACLWLGYAGLIAAFYFANTWTAKLIADTSGEPNLGIRAGMLIQFGGVAGALLFAVLALRLRPRLVTTLILMGGAMVFVLYASQIGNVSSALMLAALLGVFANGAVSAFYAISPPVYPTVARATGVGLMIAFGRSVAILAPVGTGYMLAAGWTPGVLYQFFGGVLVVSALAAALLDRSYRGRSENPETPDAPAGEGTAGTRTA